MDSIRHSRKKKKVHSKATMTKMYKECRSTCGVDGTLTMTMTIPSLQFHIFVRLNSVIRPKKLFSLKYFLPSVPNPQHKTPKNCLKAQCTRFSIQFYIKLHIVFYKLLYSIRFASDPLSYFMSLCHPK